MTQDQIIKSINDKVIEGLKEQGLKWFRPWKSGEENQPLNRLTKKYYSGFNIFLLNNQMIMNDYRSNQWLTFKQVTELNGQVKKGSRSTDIYFWKRGLQDMKKKFKKSTSKRLSQKMERLLRGIDKLSLLDTTKYLTWIKQQVLHN